MFKWTTTSFVNGLTYLNGEPSWFGVSGGTITYSDSDAATAKAMATATTNTDEKSFTVNRNVKFYKDNITKITRAKFVEPRLAELEIDFSEAALTAGDYRLYLYIRSIGDADPAFANDFVYKGKPFYIEFKATGTAATDAEKFEKTAKKWLNFLYGNGKVVKISRNGSKVTFKANDEYKQFHVAEIQKYDENALVWAHDGAFVTLFSSDPESAAYDEDVFTIVEKGRAGFGTYTQLIKDLRLPTNANTRFFRDREDALPVVNGKYWQYVITQCTERPEMQGTSVLGQYNKSITTHVIFVENAVKSAFDTELAKLGVTITEIPETKASAESNEGQNGNP